jgi:alpha-tubulin suppressor-like RCC1 family protein
MKVLRRSRRLAGCTALALTLAGAAAATATPAQAGGAVIPVLSHVVASWGDNALGQLGDGTTVSRSLSRDIAAGGDVVQVAADGTYGLALRSDGSVWAWGSTNAASWATAPTLSGSRRSR